MRKSNEAKNSQEISYEPDARAQRAVDRINKNAGDAIDGLLDLVLQNRRRIEALLTRIQKLEEKLR